MSGPDASKGDTATEQRSGIAKSHPGCVR